MSWPSRLDRYILINRRYQGRCIWCDWTGVEYRDSKYAVEDTEAHLRTPEHQQAVHMPKGWE